MRRRGGDARTVHGCLQRRAGGRWIDYHPASAESGRSVGSDSEVIFNHRGHRGIQMKKRQQRAKGKGQRAKACIAVLHVVRHFALSPLLIACLSLCPLWLSSSSSSKGLAMEVQARTKTRAPELTGDRGWLYTSKPLSLAALKGKVVMLDFWTY